MFVVHAASLERLVSTSSTAQCPGRPRMPSQPCLPANLPFTSFIQREADALAPEALRKQPQTPSAPSPSALEDAMTSPLTDSYPPASDATPLGHPNSPSSFLARWSQKLKSEKRSSATGWADPEPWRILNAVENENLEYLAQIRDRAFPMLLHNIGRTSPLIHAMVVRKPQVEIFLLGCFSRYVNNLEEDDYLNPEIMTNLRLLKGNLYSAISRGNDLSITDLIPSYVQVLVMIEGNRWIKQTVAHVAEALRYGHERHPVARAESAVRSFADYQFGKSLFLAALEDFIANAAVDLLMMAAASIVRETIQGYPIPPANGFARDNNIYKQFSQVLFKNRDAIESRSTSRLRYQMRTLDEVLAGGSLSWSGKVKVLKERLDHPRVS
ncbi:hypothetical protein FA95DRAFT_1556719 [Auriscalpium vulgare]|uniref:Uncharacterized protein n=1 Tax=Auriscalpium vulgare TaxID=40419 RepID=A0ACB8S0J7_9AGAM|nr:hypothetical protein FA95DRAFT_1556719 [Auriscalpium vulgare]